MDLTRKRLKTLLRYNPKNGVWIWRVWRGGKAVVGSQAGRYNTDGYLQICVDGRRYVSSRLAWFYMKGRWPSKEIDHKDTNFKNDKWNNLRLATDSQNQANRGPSRLNSSGVRSVYARVSGGKLKWGAAVAKNKKRHYLGLFSVKADAVHAYKEAAIRLHGEYARW